MTVPDANDNNNITVTVPNDAKTVTVNIGDDEVTFTKEDDGTWTSSSNDYPVKPNEDNGKIVITPNDKTALNGKEITAEVTDKAGNTSEKSDPKTAHTVFDKNNVTGVELTTDPTKMKYTVGDKLDLDGMTITLTDKNNNKVVVTPDKFNDYNINVTPSTKTNLTTDDNGKPITVAVGDITKTSKDNLIVTDLPTLNKPTDVKQGKDEYGNPVITGKVDKDTTGDVILVDAKTKDPIKDNSNNPITGTIDKDGNITIPLDKVPDGTEVKVQIAEKGKNPSTSDNSVTVDKTAPKGGVVDGNKVTEGDKNISLVVPNDDTSKITIKIPTDPEIVIELTKGEDGTWKDKTGTPVKVEDGKLIVNLPDNKEIPAPSTGKDTITIVTEDKAGNSTEVTVPIEKKAETPVTKPSQPTDVEAKTTGEDGNKKTTVTGKGDPNSTVVITTNDGTVVGRGTVGEDGNFTVELTNPVNPGESLTVTPEKDGATGTPKTVEVIDGNTTETKEFDKNNITGISITTEPNKMTYNTGDTLDLDGMTVTLTDKNGETVVITPNQFKDYGIVVTPSTEKGLTTNENGKPITVTVNGNSATTGNITVTDKTPATTDADNYNGGGSASVKVGEPLTAENITFSPSLPEGATVTNVPTVDTTAPGQQTVQVTVRFNDESEKNVPVTVDIVEDETPVTKPSQPTDVEAKTTGEDGNKKTTVTGKTDPNTNVTVTDKEGNTIGTGTSDENGNFNITTTTPVNPGESITVTPDNGEGITVTVKEEPKSPQDVNKDTLKDWINRGEDTKDHPQYNPNSQTGEELQNALDNAYKVLEDDKASRKDVDDAIRRLKDAIDKIVNNYRPIVPIVPNRDNSIGIIFDKLPSPKKDNESIVKESPIRRVIKYVKGYEDGSFKPESNITRAEAAMMFARLLTQNNIPTGTTSLKDVAKDAWYTDAISYVVNNGYMKGYEDGTFKPNQKITRAEFAKMLSKYVKENGKVAPFTDTQNHWAKEAIDRVYGAGIIDGYTDGTFKPDKKITRAEAVKMFNKTFDRSTNETELSTLENKEALERFNDTTNHWAYYEIIEASNTRDEHYVDSTNWVRIVEDEIK